MTILIFTAIVVFIVVSLIFCLSWIGARVLCKPLRKINSKTPEDFGLPVEKINFVSENIKIKGWFIPASYSLPGRPVIILCHGWSSNLIVMFPLAKKLHESGFNVLFYNTRGHGESGSKGPVTLLKFAVDLNSAVDFIFEQKIVDYSKIGVVGHSLGGAASILASNLDPRIKSVVTCSSFADPKISMSDFLRHFKIPYVFIKMMFFHIERWLGKPIDNIAPKNNIDKINVPLLLCHGATDRIVSPSNTDFLYEASDKKLSEKFSIPQRGHSDVIRDTRFMKKVVAFFKYNFGEDKELQNSKNIFTTEIIHKKQYKTKKAGIEKTLKRKLLCKTKCSV